MKLDAEWMRKAAILSLVSIKLLVYTVGGFWLGSFLDKSWDVAPYMSVLGTLLGFVLFIIGVFALLSPGVKKQ